MKLHYLKTNLYNSIINNIFIISFSIVLFLISLNNYIVFIGLIIYILYVYKKDKNLFYLSIIICAVIFVVFIAIKMFQISSINNYNNAIIGKVIKLEQKDYYQKITLKHKIFKVIVKDYNYVEINLGDEVKVLGEKLAIDTNHIPNAFNYQKYFYNNLYILEIKSSEITIIDHHFSIFKISEIVNRYLCNHFDGKSLILLKGFIIGDTSDFNEQLNNALKANGIIHLFAISGSHITLIISFYELIFKKTNNKSIINLVLFLYLLITRFAISITRAVLTYYLNQIFKKYSIKLSSMDSSCIVFIILVMVNPYLMFNVGFILSFAATFLIILISPYLKNMKHMKSILLITVLINIFTLPLIINMSYEYNILSPIINVLMILLVEGIIIPASFLVFIFPVLDFFYKYIILAFIYLNDLIACACDKFGLVISIGKISNILMIIYYLCILLFIIYYNNKKMRNCLKTIIVIYIMFLIIPKYAISPTITFLDLYSGDSTILEYKDEIIIIDTGEGINNELTNFLKSKGIRKIDYLILSHNHSDHNGEVNNILKEFKVTNIIVSAYDNSSLSTINNIIKIKQGDILKTKYLNIECIMPRNNSDNINNNSLVLYFKIDGVNFLFTGDIENDVDDQVPNLDVDVLKVAHHGSITSTSSSFISKIKPQYAVIMSGRNNKYGFPSEVVINRLKENNCEVYCTKYDYTITLKIKNKKSIFSTLREKLNRSIKSINTFDDYIFEMSS